MINAAKVTKPVAVRHAWADNLDCDLSNQAGLPAVPFRTYVWSSGAVGDMASSFSGMANGTM